MWCVLVLGACSLRVGRCGRVRVPREVCVRVVERVGGRRCGADERVCVDVTRVAWRGEDARCVRAVWYGG